MPALPPALTLSTLRDATVVLDVALIVVVNCSVVVGGAVGLDLVVFTLGRIGFLVVTTVVSDSVVISVVVLVVGKAVVLPSVVTDAVVLIESVTVVDVKVDVRAEVVETLTVDVCTTSVVVPIVVLALVVVSTVVLGDVKTVVGGGSVTQGGKRHISQEETTPSAKRNVHT